MNCEFGQNGTCKFNASNVGATMQSQGSACPSGDEICLMNALNQIGPISIAIQVDKDFGSYANGVYAGSNCTGGVNHGVTLVGYGSYGPG